MFSLICVGINGWVDNGEAGDLRRHRGHYAVNVMVSLAWRHHGTINKSWRVILPIKLWWWYRYFSVLITVLYLYYWNINVILPLSILISAGTQRELTQGPSAYWSDILKKYQRVALKIHLPKQLLSRGYTVRIPGLSGLVTGLVFNPFSSKVKSIIFPSGSYLDNLSDIDMCRSAFLWNIIGHYAPIWHCI